jgi:hypothetical protein
MLAGACYSDVRPAYAILDGSAAGKALLKRVHQEHDRGLQPFGAEDRVDRDRLRHLVRLDLGRLANGHDAL